MSSSIESKIAMAKTVVSTIGSVAAAAMVARSVAREYLPSELRDYFYLSFRNFIYKFSTHLTMVIYETDGFLESEIYNAAQLYLAAQSSLEIHRMKITKHRSEKNISVAMEINEEFVDVYNGVKFKWSLVSKKTPTREYYGDHVMGGSSRSETRMLELTFHRKHKDLALNTYIPFILNVSKTRKREDKCVKLFTVNATMMRPDGSTVWSSVNLDHPSNFATLAMETDVKEKLMKDLDRFLLFTEERILSESRKGVEERLPVVRSNSELRRLLVATANRSILVVEDIDCSVELHDRVVTAAPKAPSRNLHPWASQEDHKVTLSGFLNFIDGLWSSCGDERIIIFTTNRKEKLDPALLRPGRMDVHINMSYCTPRGFRLLASNYLGITEHTLFEKIDDLIREVEITPAEVAEQLLKDDGPDIVLNGLIDFFDVKRKQNEEAKKEEELAKAKAIEEAGNEKKQMGMNRTEEFSGGPFIGGPFGGEPFMPMSM
ncbi:hypothetical protein LXL04_013776 [Taraxacum kok-saghyz]